VIAYWDVYLSADHLLPRDNLRGHYNHFLYITTHLRELHSFPSWLYTNWGGLWLPVVSNNFLFLLPYRFVGYLLGATTPISPNVIYKFCFLFLGQGIFLWGIYTLAQMVFRSRFYSWMLVAVSLVTSICISVLHQEHVLGTMFFIPFIWIALIKLRTNLRYLVILFSLVGLALNVHYPQLLLGYLATIGVSSLFCFKATKQYCQDIYGQFKRRQWVPLVCLAIAAFVISASPFLYSVSSYFSKLESPFRAQKGKITASNYDDYVRMNATKSSIKPENFRKYIGYDKYATDTMAQFDDTILYLTPAIPFILFILLFLRVPHRGFHLSVLMLLSLLAMGIYGPAPRVLWNVFPGITLFRQWMFFSAYLNLHLVFLIGISLKAYFDFSPQTRKDRLFLGGGALVFILLWGLGLLSPIYALFPAILLLVKVPQVFAFAWIFGGSLWWAIGITDNYEKGLVAKKLHNDDILKTLNQTVPFSVVRPKGVNSQVIRKLSQNAPTYWVTKDKKLIPTKSDQVWTHPMINGLQLALGDIPEDAKSILLLQHDDGNWKVSKDDGTRIPTLKGPLAMVEIPVSPIRTSVTIRRGFSLWPLLTILMWFPLLFYLFVLRKPTMRTSSL